MIIIIVQAARVEEIATILTFVNSVSSVYGGV